MGKEFPIGTIRHWQEGDVIKAHDPIPPFSSGWIPLVDNAQLAAIGEQCDREARGILSHKEPINGERFLDHEINEYKDKHGMKPYTADDFKQYYGFENAGRYAFTMEFSKRFMKNKSRLAEMVAQALADANYSAGGDKNHIKLTDEERRSIREEVKRDFKGDDDAFSMVDAIALKAIVENTYVKLKEGENISDPVQKEIYDRMKQIANGLDQSYTPIREKQQLKNECIATINATFTDNWGICDSYQDYINKQFASYIKKYKDRIRDDSAEELKALLGITLDMETHEFYDTIIKKYKGLTAEQRKDYSEIFKYLIYIRFSVKFGKIVEGDWAFEHTPALKNLELAIDELPDGHFLTNDQLLTITSHDYQGGNHGGYAWYNGGEKRINFSAACIKYGSVFGVLSSPREFRSTMFHEIGHAVSQRYGRSGRYNYKKFAVECGWTYQSKELRAGMTATGDEKDIPRTGSNSYLDLISTYAKKAPEEAFAEYYSFYANNRAVIDAFIATKDKNVLKRESRWTAGSEDETRTLGHIMRRLDSDDETLDRFKSEVHRLSDRGRDIDFTLTSPWDTVMEVSEKKNYDPSYIRGYRNSEQQQIVFAYKDGPKRVVFHGGNDVEISRMNRKLCSTVEVPKEMYMHMREKGFSNSEITACLVSTHLNTYPKKQISPPTQQFGMYHRDDFVPHDQIATSYDAFVAMARIFNSDELKKALADMFDSSVGDLEKSFTTTAERYVKGEIEDDEFRKTKEQYELSGGVMVLESVNEEPIKKEGYQQWL